MTTEQILNQTKTVTRRNGWKKLMPGDLIQPIEKGMGLRKGEKQVLLGPPIRVISISSQQLHQITQDDCIKEGFPHMSPQDFIQMYMRANKCNRSKVVQRIEYEYLIEIIN